MLQLSNTYVIMNHVRNRACLFFARRNGFTFTKTNSAESLNAKIDGSIDADSV